MQRIVSYLEDDVIENIKKLYKNSDISISKMASELIDIGYKVKLHYDSHPEQQEKKKATLVDKHTEYLLKIMAICIDAYRCVRNNKSKYSEDTIDGVLSTIHTRTRDFIKKEVEEAENSYRIQTKAYLIPAAILVKNNRRYTYPCPNTQ